MEEQFDTKIKNEELAKKVRLFAYETNQTQDDIARAVGLTRQYLNRLLNGRMNISKRAAWLLENYMNNYKK